MTNPWGGPKKTKLWFCILRRGRYHSSFWRLSLHLISLCNHHLRIDSMYLHLRNAHCAHSYLFSSGCPKTIPLCLPEASPACQGNGRAMQSMASVTDVGFVTLTPLQAIPLPPFSSGIFSLHAMRFVTYKEGQGPAGCCTSLSLGHLVSNF